MECWPWLPRERGKAARHVFAGKQTSRTNRKHTRSASCRPRPGPPALTGDPFRPPRRGHAVRQGADLGSPTFQPGGPGKATCPPRHGRRLCKLLRVLPAHPSPPHPRASEGTPVPPGGSSSCPCSLRPQASA